MERVLEKVLEFVREWQGKKISKHHVYEEFKRHNSIALKACEYVGIFPFALSLYFLSEGKFYFHYFLLSIFVIYISTWAPDFLYILANFIKRKKDYIPTHKRKYSHSSFGLILWTLGVASVLLIFAIEIFWVILISSLAFIGYWLHLATDKVELFVDKVAEFLEEAVKK